MKKIDLHIHTVPTIWDAPFSFSLKQLERYVSDARLDAIAITNHNVFDGAQYRAIRAKLQTVVFPGVELNLEGGHVLLISDEKDLADFEAKAALAAQRLSRIGDSLSIADLCSLFGDLGAYLIIPHYEKEPALKGASLSQIQQYVSCGEVDSAKKFIRTFKDKSKLTPVLFSDVRVSDQLTSLPTRQTFVDCGELCLKAVNACLQDRGKVALSENDGNELFQVFDDGQKLSTGLNVLLGERSTGKTFTLDRMTESFGRVQYIKQFSLVQQDDGAFSSVLRKQQSLCIEEYLSGFKGILNDVVNIDLQANGRAVESYLRSR